MFFMQCMLQRLYFMWPFPLFLSFEVSDQNITINTDMQNPFSSFLPEAY